MSAELDSLSDAEIRSKLAEHGFPVMPVTNSTRKVLIRKLKVVLDKKKDDKRKTIASFSSGEESDVEKPVQAKSKRMTIAASSMPPPVTTTRTFRSTPIKEIPRRDSESEDETSTGPSPIKTHEEVETVTTRRVTKMYTDECETGSDSDVDGDKMVSPPYRSNSRSSDYISSTLPLSETIPKSSGYKSSYIGGRTSLSGSRYTPQSPTESLSEIRNRLGLSSSFGERAKLSSGLSSYKPSFAAGVDEVEAPYLSSFTQRLNSLKQSLPRSSTLTSDNNSTSTSYLPRKTYVRSSYGGVSGAGYKGDKQTHKNISLVLVGLFALFFFLFGIYIFKINDMSSLLEDKYSNIPVCMKGQTSDCILEEKVPSAKSLFNMLYPELEFRTKSYFCGKPNTAPYMTETGIIGMAAKANEGNVNDLLEDFNNLQFLIVHNPQWGLSVVDVRKSYNDKTEAVPLKNMEAVLRLRNGKNLGLAITNPGTPIFCKMTQFILLMANYILIAAAVICTGFGSRKLFQFYKSYQAKRTEEIYSMVEQIIDIISQEAEENPNEPYVPVDHVRDALIAPQNREKMMSIWDAAVKFIQKNESRVRLEVQSVDGEDCKAWRWVAPHGSSPRRSGTWQGQAFETQVGSVNNLSVSPTPCLKIRHMVERNEFSPELKRTIQDAILEKCGEQCKILHIDIDPASGCVYVKCATPADAGVVYRSLHGWWYEGHLITVKYLMLERYMMRFPTSPSDGPYLKPSKKSWSAK